MHSLAHARAYRDCRPAPLLFFREPRVAEPEPQRPPPLPAPVDPETATDWTGVHERLASLGHDRATHEREVCRWLRAAERLAVHARAGYASVGELAERLLGLNARQTSERLRIARVLRELKLLDAALATGELSWSAVRELTRVATVETERPWLDWAKGRRLRQLEAAVATRKPGDGPGDPSDPSRIQHRLAFQVRAETMALFRDLQSAVRADLGGDLDDDTLLYEIARRALGGPGDDGRASYQLAVTRCDACGRASIDAAGASFEVDAAVAVMAACDSQDLDLRAASTHVGTRGGRGSAAGPHPASTHVGTRAGRATQSIPPATRRAVVRRDHRRCVVPGCSNHRYLDVHHLDPRSEGGGHDPERLAILCGAHHRAVHAGVLCIDGSATAGFVFRHGEGTAYGGALGVVQLEGARQALEALERMGFRATRARALVDEALRAGTSGDAAALLRAALRAS